MSEMVERVGLAIARKVLEAKHNDLTWEDAGRAAIEAMREPTDQMIVAAYKDPSFVPNISPTGTWQAMIDEALK